MKIFDLCFIIFCLYITGLNIKLFIENKKILNEDKKILEMIEDRLKNLEFFKSTSDKIDIFSKN